MDYRVDMVITDLDGTLFNDNKQISGRDIKILVWLGSQSIIRVIATGRNLFSARKALHPETPVDFLIFSTGAGAIEWKTGKLIYAEHLRETEVALAIETLKEAGISFMVHDLVPDNHAFLYHDADCGNNDFQRRLDLYHDFAAPLELDPPNYTHASQLLAIVPENLALLEEIRGKLASMRVIRTTSPLDGQTMWLEVFPAEVSKGHTTEWLCRKTGTDANRTLGLGNDYNDIDLLNFVKFPYAMENAPDPIKKLYPHCMSNNDSGFSDAVRQVTGISPGNE